jgi:peptidoglycan hydrolase CwlO-like protein
MEEKRFKELLEEQEGKFESFIGVIKEDFDGKVQLLVEQYSAIGERLDSLDRKVSNIGKDIEITKVDIAFIKNSLKKKVDVEEFEILEKRVAILEARSSQK